MLKKIFYISIILFCIESTANAIEEKLCVKYKTSYGWSQGYKVKAKVLKGYELSKNTFTNEYNPFSEYVVIFWQTDQVTVIELDNPFINFYGTKGKDKYGRKWLVSNNNYCY